MTTHHTEEQEPEAETASVPETSEDDAAQVPIPPPQTQISERLSDAGNGLMEALADIADFASKRLRGQQETTQDRTPAPANIGEEIKGVQACLGQLTFLERAGTSISDDQVETIRASIEQFRRLLVLLNNLDRKFVRETLRVVLGPELFELFLAGQGLQHLLHTPEAWDIIAAQRESARLSRTIGTRR